MVMAAASIAPHEPQPEAEVPWHSAFPAPRNQTPLSISCFEVLQLVRNVDESGRDFILIDLRRMDHEGGTIRGSLNLPAQTLYPSIPALYSLFHAANIKKVVWYCGSSRGRGTRAAGWFEDHIQDRKDSDMKSMTLEGGIKGWSCAGEDYVQLMDGYRVEQN